MIKDSFSPGVDKRLDYYNSSTDVEPRSKSVSRLLTAEDEGATLDKPLPSLGSFI